MERIESRGTSLVAAVGTLSVVATLLGPLPSAAEPVSCRASEPVLVQVSIVTSGWAYDPETQLGAYQLGPSTTRFELSCTSEGARLTRLIEKEGVWMPVGDPVLAAPDALRTAVAERLGDAGWLFPPDEGAWLPDSNGALDCRTTVTPMPDYRPRVMAVTGTCSRSSLPGRHLEGLLFSSPELAGIATGTLVVSGGNVNDIPREPRQSSEDIAIGPNWSWDSTIVEVSLAR